MIYRFAFTSRETINQVPVLRSEQFQPLKSTTERRLCRQSKPVLEHGGIHLPEVDADLQVAVLGVQLRQARRLADQAAFHPRTRQEDRAGSAVVGARRA